MHGSIGAGCNNSAPGVWDEESLACCAYLLCVFAMFSFHPATLFTSCLVVVLNFLGTFETGTSARCSIGFFDMTTDICSLVMNKSSRRFTYMVRPLCCRTETYTSFCFVFFKFPAVLLVMIVSTIPVSIIGVKFAMSVTPFWSPIQFSKVDALTGF